MNNDFRTPLPFASIVEDTTHNHVYQIVSEIGRGGSSIVYEVSRKDNSKHYALKEYYPINEALTIRRDGCKLSLVGGADTQSIAGKYAKREQRILDRLPKNNSEDGRYFIYKEDSFLANNTRYVVTDLDNCHSLAESKIKDNLQSLLCVLTDVCKGLSALHRNGVYHLDISSRNILIPKNGCAKITDFGAAVTKEELQNHSLSYDDFVYTPAFSSIETKRAAHEGVYEDIDESSDTFSVCAVLFRYTIGRSFEPTEDLTNCAWEKDLYVKYHDKYTKSYINRLISILRKGLSGQAFRYSSAEQLADELHVLTNKVEKDKVRQKAITIVFSTLAAIASLGLLTVILLQAITPAPKLKLKDQLPDIYYAGDDIVFTLELQDTTGSDGIHAEDPTAQLELSGFTASRKVTPDKDRNTYRVTLSDIAFEEDGEKSIRLANVYQSEWFGKQNKPFICNFSGYVDEPRVLISQPTFTKVNADAGHALTYTVTFDIPEYQAANIRLSSEQLRLDGCSAKTHIEKIRDTAYSVTLSDIQGTVGPCALTVLGGVCSLQNGAVSRETTAPGFDIVENEVSNAPIFMHLSVAAQDLQDGGYILLEHESYSGQDYVSMLDDSMITLVGFTADIYQKPSCILLDNLSLEEGQQYAIQIAAGAYVSKDNGSISAPVACSPNTGVSDTTPPAVAVWQVGGKSRQVKKGGNLILEAECDDDSSCLLNRTRDMFETSGFSYDTCQLSITGLTIRVIYTNISPLEGNEGTCSVILKDATFKDLSGNESRQVKFPFTINP